MTTSKKPNPLEQKLAADRAMLVARIAETERDLAAAVKASGAKLAKTPFRECLRAGERCPACGQP